MASSISSLTKGITSAMANTSSLTFLCTMKHICVVDSLMDPETIAAILVQGREKTQWIIRQNDSGQRRVLFADVPGQRYIGADNWEPKGVPWTREKLSEFMDQNGTEFQYHTPSAFAMSLYRHLNKGKLPYMYLDGFKARLARASLYGGRCEVYRYGEYHAHQYDINGCYPYASTAISFPDPRSLRFVKPAIENIWRYDGVSRVTVTQEAYMPYLPIRQRGRIYYASCELHSAYEVGVETTYTHNELRNALEQGVLITAIHRQMIGERKLKPFDEYMHYCYTRRDDDPVWKLIANSLIGRIAVYKGEVLKYRPAMTEGDLMTHEPSAQLHMGVWHVGERIEMSPDSNPLWSAMVLAEGRRMVYNMARETHSLYMDTDCVFAEYERSCFTLGPGIGEVKHTEGDYEVKGAKLYSVRANEGSIVIKMKGVHGATPHAFEHARNTSSRFTYKDGTTRAFILDDGALV